MLGVSASVNVGTLKYEFNDYGHADEHAVMKAAYTLLDVVTEWARWTVEEKGQRGIEHILFDTFPAKMRDLVRAEQRLVDYPSRYKYANKVLEFTRDARKAIRAYYSDPFEKFGLIQDQPSPSPSPPPPSPPQRSRGTVVADAFTPEGDERIIDQVGVTRLYWFGIDRTNRKPRLLCKPIEPAHPDTKGMFAKIWNNGYGSTDESKAWNIIVRRISNYHFFSYRDGATGLVYRVPVDDILSGNITAPEPVGNPVEWEQV